MTIKSMASYVKNYVILLHFYEIGNAIKRMLIGTAMVEDIDGTLDYILENGCSVSRYGDGELLWMYGVFQDSFHRDDPEMARRLREIIRSDVSNHIVCLPNTFESLGMFNKEARLFWSKSMFSNRKRWLDVIDKGRTYYCTQMTRPYIDYRDKSNSDRWFNKLKRLWNGKDVILLEGSKSRLGVGNDLFDGCKSLKRILGPARDAYDFYDVILDYVIGNIAKDNLILIALGPVATILAFDLSQAGYQAIDVGHVDIEYEWFKMGATEKTPIEGKYTNEALGTYQPKDEINSGEKYFSQVLITFESGNS